MADDKPQCVHTCTADECEPLDENHPRWFNHHMPCWCCFGDDHSKRHDLVWHEESRMYFHKLCLLERARQHAMDAATAPDAPLQTVFKLKLTGSLLRIHRQQLALRGL